MNTSTCSTIVGVRSLASYFHLARTTFVPNFTRFIGVEELPGVNCFGFNWGVDNCWIHPPFRTMGKVWRKLKTHGSNATIIVPLWTLATWWHLIALDSVHLSNSVID